VDPSQLKGPEAYIRDSIAVYERMLADRTLMTKIVQLGAVASEAVRSGGKIVFAGNGGSAADAQHFAGELVSRFYYDRPGIASLALTTDSSILTAIANDYQYERIFSRQIEALGRSGDVFVGISTSGRSPNVLGGLVAARRLGLTTVGLTGQSGGDMAQLCDIVIRIPSDSTPLIQQGHLVVGHLLCGMIEEAIHPRERNGGLRPSEWLGSGPKPP
jgi:D-sedoheptulose 7-phosphate isomerase